MQAFDEEQDSGGSQDGSSDDEQNEQNEHPEPIDEGDDQDGDEDGEDDDDDGEDENDDDDPTNEQDESTQRSDGDLQLKSSTQASNSGTKSATSGGVPSSLGETPHLPPPNQPNPAVVVNVPSPKASPSNRGTEICQYSVRPEALAASVYDIVPTIAAPHSTSINVVTATPDLRWVFSGGSDGYIRKFNWLDTANGKLMLTVAQRHPFVDSVTKAGVLTSYWENEEPQAKPGEDGQSLSPVYSLAVHSQALWLLSGLESGGINLQSVRHDEGKRIHCLRKHTSAVSVLNLAQDEKSVLSGSWDKLVMDWDLDTGNVKRSFDGSGGQISALEMRPASSLPVPETSGDPVHTNGTVTSNNGSKSQVNGIVSYGIGQASTSGGILNEEGKGGPSPVDSLFGEDDNNSLFGEGTHNAGFGDDDDEFSRAVANGVPQPENEDEGDVSMIDAGPDEEPSQTYDISQISTQNVVSQSSTVLDSESVPQVNGLPHAEDTEKPDQMDTSADAQDSPPKSDTTFLAASMNGSICIWDKRQPNPVAKIVSRNAPPWCMGACWSPDGNFIYAGRRNGTVEEFSLHKGFRQAERTFKFPSGSGSVSAVRAMPNGRHLVCASYDILRLYDLSQQQIFKHSTVPFLIVPGHRTGVVSQLYIDPTCRFMISTAGNRGWEGNSTQVLLGYEINI